MSEHEILAALERIEDKIDLLFEILLDHDQFVYPEPVSVEVTIQ